MRVLWVDADGNPWTDSNGWKVLEDFGLEVRRVPSVAEAQKELPNKDFDFVLIRAEASGAPSLMVQCRRLFSQDGRKIIIVSSEWSKEQFKTHSKTDGAAHRYARVPMPPEGFLSLVADTFGCTVEEIADFTVPEQSSPEPEQSKERDAPVRRAKSRSESADSGDLDVLRKYLAIREEQLEIAESDRDELSHENERLQKEAHQLQLRLREFEHIQDELQKKIVQMEELKAESEKKALYAEEERDREKRSSEDKIKAMEQQIAEAGDRYENLRTRVRKDIRKIRENERDLEARLELMRKDSETLISARDSKILDLQRKLDALEFDLDQVQDGRVQAQMEAERYLAKLSRVSRALQIATSMIESDLTSENELEELEPELGGAGKAETVANPEPAAAAAPPPSDDEDSKKQEEVPDSEHSALASDGDPTQMISRDAIKNAGGESGSSG